MAVRLEELAQSRHRHLVLAADVDAAQEDEVSGHRGQEDATTEQYKGKVYPVEALRPGQQMMSLGLGCHHPPGAAIAKIECPAVL